MSVNRKLELICPKGHGTYGADSPNEECPACADNVPTSIAQQIKNILVSLAAADKLPLDMTELDPVVFEPALAGAVFPGDLKDRYVSLEVPLKINVFALGAKLKQEDWKLFIQVKLDDEGMVIDATLEGDNEPCASTWKTYQMMKDGEE
jgi:hypothetical protein